MNSPTEYIATVVGDGDNLSLVFPSNMMEELGWTDGDTIIWEINESNNVVIARKARDGED